MINHAASMLKITASDPASNIFSRKLVTAEITDVSVVGTPSLTTNSGPTNDTVGVRWHIETSTGTAVWGDTGSDAASACSAVLGNGVSSDTITDGSAPSPAPTTAVSADWDNVASQANYTAQAMPDGETVDWNSFTLRVTYTPGQAPISKSPDLKALTLDDTLTPLAGVDRIISPAIKSLVLTEVLAVDFQGRGLRLTGLEPTRVVDTPSAGINILRLRREGYA